MPGNDELQNELQFKKQQQLNKEIRVGSEHNADRLKRKDRDLYNKRAVKQDIVDINAVLTKDQQLTEEEKANLQVLRGRNLSTLLILEEKTTGDSKLMKKVKKAVAGIEGRLNEEKQNWQFTEADVVEILRLYDTAILACKDYMFDKGPAYKTGRERYDMVKMNMLRLHEEADSFLVAKEMIRSGMLNGQAVNARMLLVQAKTYKLLKGRRPEGEEPQREAPSEQALSDSGYEAKLLYEAFSGKETPSDMINRLSRSKKKKDKEFSEELIRIFANIRGALEDFQMGKIAAKVFMIGDTVISVHQNAFGQLSINAGGVSLPLERHTGIIKDMLTTDIIKNESLYGKAASDKAIRDVLDKLSPEKNGTQYRQILTDYLVKHTRYPVTDFSNFFTNDLAYMVRCVLAGRKFYIIESAKELDFDVIGKETIFSKENAELVTVMESRELLQGTQKEVNRKKVTDKVQVKQQQAQAEPEAGEQQEKKKEDEKKEGEWSEKEKKIIHLLGDVIFSYDTWTADEKLQDPGKRMQLMLAKNVDGMAYLISDMFGVGTLNMKLVNGILDQMPLFMMEKKEAEKLRKTVIDGLNAAAEAIKKEVDEKIKQSLGNRPAGFLDGLFYDTKKGLAVTGSRMHLASAESLLSGIEIKNQNGEAVLKIDSLKDIIMNIGKESLESLASAEGSIDQGVKKSSDMIQKTVSKYSGELFKPKAMENEAPLPNPYAPNLTEEEIKARKIARYNEGNRRLEQMVKDSMTSGSSGLGLFTKQVFDNYFKGVNTMDQRAMLASMIRNAKPVGKLLDEKAPNLSAEEKKAREEHNEKVMTDSMGNYLGGLLKGAGPLFQKMMQGLPLEGLPEELRSAVEDMKSRLAPIPDEIVEAQLYNMIQRSHKQIKNIKVVKPLGAASVGQTFLCEITKADGTVEEAAIKLLKPDVNNRMMREKDLMIKCARQTDILSRQKENEERQARGQKLLPEIKSTEKGGMQMTYEGQLERIQEELDLTIEARNVELGKIYDKAKTEAEEKVVSMKLSPLVAPTTNAMVLEKAPGETIDALLKRIREETNRLRDLYKRKVVPGMSKEKEDEIKARLEAGELYYKNAVELATDRNIPQDSDEYRDLQPRVVEQKLEALLGELKKKKTYLDAFAKKWTEEGLFKDGFYHGDPHDGNIMVSDEKLTVIDFGNCTKLTEEQQGHVTRMMCAASTGNMEMFRSGLHALLDPRFEELYQEKRTELGRQIKEVFGLGDQRSAGARIMVALLRAQSLGLEVPSAVYNFSQGQLRLQNAVNNMNAQIEDTQKAIYQMAKKSSEDAVVDMSEEFRSEESVMIPDLLELPDENLTEDQAADQYVHRLANKYLSKSIKYTCDRDCLKEILSDYHDEFKETFVDPISELLQDKDCSLEQIMTNFETLWTTRKGVPPEYQAQKPWTLSVTTQFARGTRLIGGDLVKRITDGLNSDEPTEQWAGEIREELRNAAAASIDKYRQILDSYRRITEQRERVQRKNKGSWKPNEEEKAAYGEASEQFAELYLPEHIRAAEKSDAFEKMITKLTNPYFFQERRSAVKWYFERHPEGSEGFLAAYNEFGNAIDSKLEERDPAAFREIKKKFSTEYHKVMDLRLRSLVKTFSDAGQKGEKVDFLSIMADVLEDQIPKLLSRLGFFESWKTKKKFNAQKAEAVALGISKD